jgi:N-acetyl-alpha-D-glucosaminyl L-malate synthase BshA
MRVGVVCYPSFGGSGVIAVELAIGLLRRGHQVHVIASAPPSRPLPEGASFHQIAIPSYPLFEHPPYELAIASKIAEVSQRHSLDLINVHYAVPHAASAHLARQVLGEAAPALVTTLHGTDVTGIGVDPSFLAITRFTVARSDGITVPSRFLADAARQRFGAEVPLEIIPNFVDTDRFAPSDDQSDDQSNGPRDPILFHVSNFRPVKRVLDLIEVLARVRRRIPARLVCVGDGPDRSRAEAHARALGVADSVEFRGNRTDFAAELARATLFLLPSELESFGLAALEAMSAGVPVIAYRVGGLPEVVLDGVTGKLVEPHGVDALAAAALELSTDAEAARRLGGAAREHVLANFRTDPAIERYERHFLRVLDAARAKRHP